MIISIQLLRAISAIVIIFYHIIVNQRAETIPVQVLRVGVDAFFVISGYIISRSTETAVNPVHFLARRFLRIYPVWWAALTMWLLLNNFIFGENDHVLRIITSFALILSWSDRYQFFAPIYHIGWSLCYEVLFYVVWAISVAIAPQIRLRPLVIAVGLIGGMIICARIILKVAPGIHELQPYTSTLSLEFLAGAMIRQAERSGFLTFTSHAAKRWYPWVGVGVSVVGLALIASGILPISISGALAIMIVMAFLQIHIDASSIGGRLCTYLGNASYSIYLFHAIILDVVFVRTGLLTRNEPDVLNAVMAFTACLGFSLAMYHLVEKPCLFLGKHLTSGWGHPLRAAQL